MELFADDVGLFCEPTSVGPTGSGVTVSDSASSDTPSGERSRPSVTREDWVQGFTDGLSTGKLRLACDLD